MFDRGFEDYYPGPGGFKFPRMPKEGDFITFTFKNDRLNYHHFDMQVFNIEIIGHGTHAIAAMSYEEAVQTALDLIWITSPVKAICAGAAAEIAE